MYSACAKSEPILSLFVSMKKLLEVTAWSIWLRAMTFGSASPDRGETRVTLSAGVLAAVGRNQAEAYRVSMLLERSLILVAGRESSK